MIIVGNKKRNQTHENVRLTFEDIQEKLNDNYSTENLHDLCKIKKVK